MQKIYRAIQNCKGEQLQTTQLLPATAWKICHGTISQNAVSVCQKQRQHPDDSQQDSSPMHIREKSVEPRYKNYFSYKISTLKSRLKLVSNKRHFQHNRQKIGERNMDCYPSQKQPIHYFLQLLTTSDNYGWSMFRRLLVDAGATCTMIQCSAI